MPDWRSRGRDYLERRFGVDLGETGYRLEQVSGDLWLVSRELETELETETRGVRFLRVLDTGLKPTTYGLQLLGDRIERNTVEVSREELVKLLRRDEMVERQLEEEGYVALEFSGKVVGCGFYRDGKVSSRVPKGRGKELAGILEQDL